jgi:hypothetical protein
MPIAVLWLADFKNDPADMSQVFENVVVVPGQR